MAAIQGNESAGIWGGSSDRERRQLKQVMALNDPTPIAASGIARRIRERKVHPNHRSRKERLSLRLLETAVVMKWDGLEPGIEPETVPK